MTLAISMLFMAGCGVVHLGTSANDIAPSGTLVASGPFSGGSVSGSALIYDEGNGSYVLRLVGYTGPTGVSNVGAVISAGGSTVAVIQLTVSSGTKNYSFSAGTGYTFNAVTIRNLANSTDISVATLQ
jgi:hypothetical protein